MEGAEQERCESRPWRGTFTGVVDPRVKFHKKDECKKGILDSKLRQRVMHEIYEFKRTVGYERMFWPLGRTRLSTIKTPTLADSNILQAKNSLPTGGTQAS